MMPIFNMSGIGVAASIASLATSLIIVLSQKWHARYTLDHDLKGVQKYHTLPVPRIGGIAIFIGIIFSLTFLAITDPILSKIDHVEEAFLFVLAVCPAFIAGTLEDLTKSVSVRIRFTASILSALLASWLVGATLHTLDIWGVDTLLRVDVIAVAVTAFAVSGGINAINIIDGFHGLAAVASIIMLVALGFLAWTHGDAFVTQLALVGAGGAFGFLLVNYPTGRLFVGDGGAYLLGFWVTEIAVLLIVRNPTINAWQAFAICAYPIIEVLFSIYRRRFVRKTSATQPDRLHMHSLIYRRLVCQIIHRNKTYPWIRNASVVLLVGAWIAAAAHAALLFGDTVSGAVIVVLVQVVLYTMIYARFVRGHWSLVWRKQNKHKSLIKTLHIS